MPVGKKEGVPKRAKENAATRAARPRRSRSGRDKGQRSTATKPAARARRAMPARKAASVRSTAAALTDHIEPINRRGEETELPVISPGREGQRSSADVDFTWEYRHLKHPSDLAKALTERTALTAPATLDMVSNAK